MTPLLDAMYQALYAPAGVVIRVENVQQIKTTFYNLRNQHQELRLLSLITVPLVHNELAIVKKEALNAARGIAQSDTEPSDG